MGRREEPLRSSSRDAERPPNARRRHRSMASARRASANLERLPEPLRRLEPGATYPVEVADESRSLRRRSTAGWKCRRPGRDREKGARQRRSRNDRAEMSRSRDHRRRRPHRRRRAERFLSRRRAGGAAAATRSCRSINRSPRDFDNVVLTQDWHPAGHSSFASTPSGSSALRDHPNALWPADAVAGPLRARNTRRRISPRAATAARPNSSCARAFAAIDQAIRRSTRTTARRRPGSPAILRERGIPGCFWPASRSIFAYAIRPKTPGAKAQSHRHRGRLPRHRPERLGRPDPHQSGERRHRLHLGAGDRVILVGSRPRRRFRDARHPPKVYETFFRL